MARFVMAAIAVALFANVAAAQQVYGDCNIVFDDGSTLPTSKKTCGLCQWECLTNSVCASATWNDISGTQLDWASVDCGDSTFPAGLCVLYTADEDGVVNVVVDTQHQGCEECTHQCETWKQCAGVVYNYVDIPRADLAGYTCAAPPPPPPAVIVIPSPVPVVPSPVPVVPSPVPVIPSPIPPPPSPRPSQPGIVVRPGICNYDIINYEITEISSQVIFDSDDCCALCRDTTGCNVAQFCFDSEDNNGCGADGSIPRYTCRLGTAVLGADGFPVASIPTTDPESKGWITVTVTPANVPGLFNPALAP